MPDFDTNRFDTIRTGLFVFVGWVVRMGTVTQFGARVARVGVCSTALLFVLALDPVRAQSTWNGATNDYNTAGNWTPGTVPAAAGQSAIFDTTGSTTINVSSPVAPDSWTFNSNSQGYTIGGSAVSFGLAGASGGIINNANSGQTIAISNNIGGASAQVQQLGGNLLILGGNNTYSGGTTIAGGGGVQVQTNTALGTGAVSLNGGTLLAGADGLTVANTILLSNSGFNTIDSNGGTFTLSGQIKNDPLTGPGTVEFQDSGSLGGAATTILTNSNTYTGGTLICFCATLQLGTTSAKGSIIGNVNNLGQLFVVNSDTSGITSITNSGFVEFQNTTNAGTATITNNATVVFQDASSAGSANITNNGGGIFFGNPGGTDTSSAGQATISNIGGGLLFYASSSGGSASISNTSGGQIEFHDSSTAGKASIVNDGSVISFFDNSTAGNANIVNQSFAATIFYGATTAGTTTITNNNNGITFIGSPTPTDTASADHATIINNFGGMTEFSAHSTAANATITTNPGGQTLFLDNSTGGDAQFVTKGTGLVDFGGSRGANGDGRITAGSISGSGTYYIGGGNTLIVGSNNLSSEVSGVIADFNPCGCGSPGPGSLTKVGTGKLNLSGINTYTGATIVNGGILSVNGSITSSSGITVNAGGTLGGNGQLPSVTINGGTLAPGNSIGIININGSLTFTAASTYLVEVSSTAADRTNVTGAATLAGTVSLVIQTAPSFSTVYTILSAASARSGTFGPISSGNPLVTAVLSYTSSDVQLSFSPNLTPFAGTTINQRSAGTGLQTGLIGRDPGAFGGLFTLSPAALPAALTQLSGELGTGLANASLLDMDQFLQLMLDPFVDGRNAGTAGPTLGFAPDRRASTDALNQLLAFDRMATKAPKLDAYSPRWTVWGGAYGASATLRGDATVAGSHDIAARNAGFAAGVDYLLTPDSIAGFALTGSSVSYGLATGLGSGNGDTIKGGAYVSQRFGNAFVSASLAVGRTDARTDRLAVAGGVFDHLIANPNGTSIGGRLEAGYRAGTWFGTAFIPYAALQAQTFRTNAYSEIDATGLNAFALNYNATNQSQVRSELGGRFDFGATMIGAATLSWRARAAWAHDYSSAPSIGAAFQALPGSNFAVIGAQRARDAALLSIGPEMSFGRGWSLRAKFDGEFAGNSQIYGGTGTLRYTW
jgi:autotransporter-associated beta strand protein